MLKKLLCLLCVGILLAGCGQPTKKENAESNGREVTEERLSNEEVLIKNLKDASYVVEDGSKEDHDMKNYVTMKTSKKDDITLDVFIFKDDDAAIDAFKTKLNENDKVNVVVTIDATKNEEALGYVVKDNLVVRVRIPHGSVDDIGKVFADFHLPK